MMKCPIDNSCPIIDDCECKDVIGQLQVENEKLRGALEKISLWRSQHNITNVSELPNRIADDALKGREVRE